jgi:hypothetical protein
MKSKATYLPSMHEALGLILAQEEREKVGIKGEGRERGKRERREEAKEKDEN